MKTLTSKLLLPSGQSVGTGWLPPFPDMRDYQPATEKVKKLSKKLSIKPVKDLPPAVDLRQWCSPVENQGELGSCTAHAGAGIVEYFEKRAFNKSTEVSRLFLYKATRNLMQVNGDGGAFIRCTMGALVLCGVAEEKYWPYNIENFDVDPPAFIYSIADNYEALTYFCHDPAGTRQDNSRGRDILDSVKKYLEAGIPSMFGFWGFPSFEKSNVKGGIPYPCDNESAKWGHAVVAVGYDDTLKIKNLVCGKETKGALLIRNSWGESWGDKGYGWLPYDYISNGLALDFWSLLGMGWVESGQFAE